MKRGTRQRLSPNCWSAMSRKSEAAADFGATSPTTSRARITIRGLNNGPTHADLCHPPGGRGRRAGQGRAGLGRPERRAEPEAHRERGRARLGWAEGPRPPGGAAAHRHSHARRRAVGVATVGGLGALVDRSISAADAIGKTADKIGVGVEALQELRFAAKASGVEQQTLDMALQRFVRRVAEAGNGTYGHRAARPETIGPEAVRSGVGHTPHKRWLDQPAALGSGAGTRSRPWRFPRHGLTGARARSFGPHFGEHPRLDRCSADFDYQEYGFGLMTEACTISSGGG